jgi:hypothetical protein
VERAAGRGFAGLFAFAVLAAPPRTVRGAAVPWVAPAAPALCALLDADQATGLPGGWRIALEMLVIHGALTFAGLWAASRRRPPTIRSVIGE